jgi:hypothetical protein
MIRRYLLAEFGCVCLLAAAQAGEHAPMHDMHSGASSAAVSLDEMRKTVDQLDRARAATKKYADVSEAVKDGYAAIGPYTPGMGFHYANEKEARRFDIEHPPMLLYEKDAGSPQGLRLTGVSYLWAAPAGPDGQPQTSPFPKALATWHKHANLCLTPDNGVKFNFDAAGCGKIGGRFEAETQWMVHAWIWKDSPDGVFSPVNRNISLIGGTK